MSIEEFRELKTGMSIITINNGRRWRIIKAEERRITEFNGEESVTWELTLREKLSGAGPKMIVNELIRESVIKE